MEGDENRRESRRDAQFNGVATQLGRSLVAWTVVSVDPYMIFREALVRF
jgi:hypothetical protein